MIPGKQYTPEALLRIAWRRKWVIVVPAVAIASIASTVTYRLPNLYRSSALIQVVPQRIPESYVRSPLSMRIEDRVQTLSQLILSRSRLERIIVDLNLYADRRKTEIMEDVVDRMRGDDIQIQVVKGEAFTVSYTAGDPRTAKLVAERLASFFIDESLRDRDRIVEGASEFLDSQLQDARRQLIENEKKLEDYRRRHNGELPTQVDANYQGLHNTEMQLQALTDSLNRDRDHRLVLERVIADANAPEGSGASPAPGPGIAGARGAGSSLADQLRSAESGLREMLMKLKPGHPDVLRMKREVADLQRRAELEAAEQPISETPLPPAASETARRRRLEEAKAELGNLDKQTAAKTEEERRLRRIQDDYQKRIEAAPTRASEMVDLTRDYETLSNLYRNLLGRREDAQISANLERRQMGEQFKLLDAARVPERPYSPDRQRWYLSGIGAALGVGLGLAALLEYLDRGMRSEEDVELALNLMVLATIPVLPGPRAANRRRLVAVSVAAAGAVVSAAVVAWKLLR